MSTATCSDLNKPYKKYAQSMSLYTEGKRLCWDWTEYTFDAFDHFEAFGGTDLPEGCLPTTSQHSLPPGYSMYTWDKSSGKVKGNAIIVPADKSVRPFIEAHELGHAWNRVEGGIGKYYDEYQACLRGARFIPYNQREEYWDVMWHYLNVLGVQLTWTGLIFSHIPDQLTAMQFAWSVANDYFVLATPMAIPLTAMKD